MKLQSLLAHFVMYHKAFTAGSPPAAVLLLSLLFALFLFVAFFLRIRAFCRAPWGSSHGCLARARAFACARVRVCVRAACCALRGCGALPVLCVRACVLAVACAVRCCCACCVRVCVRCVCVCFRGSCACVPCMSRFPGGPPLLSPCGSVARVFRSWGLFPAF